MPVAATMRRFTTLRAAILVVVGFAAISPPAARGAAEPEPARAPAAPVTLVRAGHLIDGLDGKVRGASTIVVRGDRIHTVESGWREPAAGETLIDFSTSWVLPGLIDLHVHLSGETSATQYLEGFIEDAADSAFRSVMYGRRTLAAGFTTVRNPGDDYDVTISLRDAIRKGWVDGPRIFSAGKGIGTTGGHADPTNGWADLIEGDPGPKDGVVNGPFEAAKAVRQRYKDGADFIKITATGGVLSLARSPDAPQFTAEELEAIVRTANDYGFPVAAHAHGKEGMKRAVLAGVTSIEHGTFMDDEVMRLMKKHGTWYVPTLSAGVAVGRFAEIEGYYPEVVRPKARKVGAQILDTFAKAYRAGVKIAFGTDAAVFPHGENGKEFRYMVDGGMPAMEAIQAATSRAAEVLRATADLGAIAPGRYADFVAVPSDPVANVDVLADIAKSGTVILGGKRVASAKD